MQSPLRHLMSRRRLYGSLRVTGFLLLANAALTSVGVSLARAQAEGAAKSAGLGLLRQLGPVLVGAPQAVTLNGQRMFLGSKLSPLTVHEVMSRFEQHCDEPSSGFDRDFEALPRTDTDAIPEELDQVARWLTSRTESPDGEAGQLACFAGKTGGGLRGLLSRIRDFALSGDLARLGDMRYVIARRDDRSAKTHVLVMWTEGSFNLRSMFPKTGDVPGGDSDNAPRPPDSVRILSSQLGDLPYAIRMYTSSVSRDEVLQSYVQAMTARGFAAPAMPVTQGDYDLTRNARAFVKGAGAVLVVIGDAPDHRSVVSLLEMGGRGFVQAYEKEPS